MPKVALYARYSTDNQSVVSIEDQFRICREHAGREGWQVVDTYHDAAISGASVILRPGVQSLLQDAQRGKFDIVLAEALDRVSRDQADVATLFKHLHFSSVQIVTLAEGEISELHVGLKGTMNALFLKDLAAKTHRGLRGRVEKGKAGGGLCYGYDVVKRTDRTAMSPSGQTRTFRRLRLKSALPPISDIAGRPQVKEANTRRPYYAGWASDDARVAV
jgi:DNA invertase Pin-like site-specific DNA recombinase